MALIAVDTTFLIDLQRDSPAVRGSIRRFLDLHAEDEFCISVTALGEFAAGFAELNHRGFLAVRRLFKLSEHDEEVASAYASIYRDLKGRGELIGANDLWIAASALRHGASLVTRNTSDFRRIHGLNVLGY